MSRNGMDAVRPLRVLVDMDGVMCDFEAHVLDLFRQRHPDDPYVALCDRRAFYAKDDYIKHYPDLGLENKVDVIIREEHYFSSMPEIDGAVDAIKEMSGIDGVEVFLCSTAVLTSKYCAQEKHDWLTDHLGADWAKRLILTHDKTLVNGDLLIDDKPIISGVVKPPSWHHILFSQCHNKHLTKLTRKFTTATRRLDNWTDGTWREIIEEYRKKVAS